MFFFEMQQAPLQVRPENTFATKATRGYTKQQEEFLHTDARPLACLLLLISQKQKTLTRLPPWTSSWAILILHLQTPERRKGTANWGQKQELTSSGDVNYPSFTFSKLGGWMWKDHEKGLTCFALAPCHFLGSKLQVCKEPFPMTSLPQISVSVSWN